MNELEKQPSWLGKRLNVGQKIIVGFLVVALFSLAAILFALIHIQQQVDISGALVHRDFKALNLVRDLRANLFAQERLEQQFLILKDEELLVLLKQRNQEFDTLWSDLLELDLDETASLQQPATALVAERGNTISLLTAPKSRKADAFLSERLAPLRSDFHHGIDNISQNREQLIDASLLELNRQSILAYRTTLVLLILGVAIGGAVAFRVVRSINLSIQRLTFAARQASEGRFDFNLGSFGRDEFGHLASEFLTMGKKLLDLKKRLLDANPLTHLPGNLAIEHELDRRIVSLEPFAHIYVDLDHFKAFNDRYGYQMGSEVIARVGNILKEVVELLGNTEDLVGHIGGDDYLLLSTPDKSEDLAKEIITRFDQMTDIYSKEDLENGYYDGVDRFGDERRYPLMSISVAVICSENLEYPTPQDISQECAKMKEHLKNLPGSNYLVDRRRR